ncbi:MAG: oxidoreductase [Bacteroidetes bacterium GWF2_40_14]|nr:MAG: oxidoreductase [Bacteroidetes bacterium GWF2_40_14]
MKVLIIGLGSIGKKHVLAIKTVRPDVDIIALRSHQDAENFMDVKNIYALDEIEKPVPDFVIISNPTSEHKKTVSELIKFNIPLFIEKPIFSSLNIQKLIDNLNSTDIFTYVACNLRFLDCIRFIKEQKQNFNQKRLNEVNVYCGSYLPDWRLNIDFRKTYSAIPELGGGVHIDLIHELDYIYWLFGSPIEVKRTYRNQSSLDISAYDYANYLLDYEGFCVNIVLNYYRREPKRNLELVFEDETWNVDLLKNQVVCKNQILFSSEQRISNTYLDQMKYFIGCIQNKNKSINTVNDAYNVLKICLDK